MGMINTNAKSFVTIYKISPIPSLLKRGIKSPPLKKGDRGGFCNFNYYVYIILLLAMHSHQMD